MSHKPKTVMATEATKPLREQVQLCFDFYKRKPNPPQEPNPALVLAMHNVARSLHQAQVAANPGVNKVQ